MPGLFSRIKTWVSLEDVIYSDLNAEFDNVITNFVPLMMDDYSANATQMQVQTDPGESGSESLATTLAGELARLRFVINEMKGTTYWYSSATSSLSELANAVGGGIIPNRISAGKTLTTSDSPAFLVPNGAARTITLDVTPTTFTYYIAGTSYSISTTDVSVTSMTAAPSANNTTLVNDAAIADQEHTKYLGEYGSVIPIDNIGSEISSLNGKLAAFSLNNGSATEYFIGVVDTTNNVIKHCTRGAFIDSTSAAIPRVAFADNDTITLMKLTWVYAKTDGTLTISYTNPRVSATEPSSPATGDYWFDLSLTTPIWKTYSGASWGSATATLIGICMQNTTATIAARSFDFFKSYSEQNSVTLKKESNTEIRSIELGQEVSVNGATIRFGKDFARWNTATDFETGVTEAANTLYYLYVTEDGAPKISDKFPTDRRGDLRGLYHPIESWRCVGQVWNNGSSNFEEPLDYVNDYGNGVQLHHSLSGNALTVYAVGSLLKPIEIPDVTTGVVRRRLLPPLSLTVSSGSTLGHTSAVADFVHAYMLSNSNGNAELAVSGLHYDSGIVATTVAEGGAGGADTKGTIYSGTARTSVPLFCLGRLGSTQTTAGTWATALDSGYVGNAFETASGRFLRVTEFTGSGTYNKNLAARFIKVTVIGGGGGGGSSGNNYTTSNGGGGGGCAIKWIPNSAVGSTETVTVGAGGTGNSGAAGTAGGTSSFGSHCSATGGGAGLAWGSNGAAGGTGSGGNINIAGGPSSGNAEYSTASADCIGAGGNSFLGGGGYVAGTASNGTTGGSYGGGGGGAHRTTGAVTGGSGAAGYVVVEEYA